MNKKKDSGAERAEAAAAAAALAMAQVAQQQMPRPGVDAATLNAIVDAMGAIVTCLAKQMSPEAKDTFGRDLARLSAQATASGNALTGTLLADISRAAIR